MKLKTLTLSRILLFGLLVNLTIAPAVYAVNNAHLSRSTAYAIGLLLVVVLGLAIYLSLVIIQPERF